MTDENRELSVISEDFEFRGRKLATSRFFQTIVLVTKDAKTANNWNAQSGMSDLASRTSESWINQHPNQPLLYITITLERMNGKTIDPVWALFQDNPSQVIFRHVSTRL